MSLVHQDAGRRHPFDGAPVHRRLAQRHGRAHRAPELDDLLAHAHRPEQARQQARLVAAQGRRLIDSRGAVENAEQTGRIFGAFRGAETEEAAGVERVVEGAAHLFLQLAVEINEHVAA